MAAMKSSRADGRGHWPKGRPRHRNLKLPGWKSPSDFLSRLLSFARDHRLYRQLARDCNVQTSTLWRWGQGHHMPDQEMLDRLVAWYRFHRAEQRKTHHAHNGRTHQSAGPSPP